MSKYTVAQFVASFPFLAEAIDPDCLGGSNGHFLKRLNGSEQAAIKSAYDAFENGQLMLANHPELLAECKAVLPNYEWAIDALVVAYLTGRLGRVSRSGTVKTGSTTVFSCGQKAIALKEKLFNQLVYGGTSGQAARNDGEIFVHKYDAMTGKRKRATPADAENVAASGQASAEEKALAAAILSDDRIPAFFDEQGKLVYGLPSPEMVDAPKVAELAEEHGKLKADQDAIAATVGTLKKELTKKKLAAAKREQFQAQVVELENQLKGIALKLTRIENDPLFSKAG